VQALAPYLNIEDIGGGAYEPDAGCADGVMATNAYANRAKDLGATILQGVEVTAISSAGGRVSGVKTSQGDYSAPVRSAVRMRPSISASGSPVWASVTRTAA